MPTKVDLVYAGELTIVTCWCSIRLAIPSELYAWAQGGLTERDLHCPLGHTFVFRENDAARLKRELDISRRALKNTNEMLDTEQARTRAYKGQVTKIKNRIVAGVCPFGCRRHFANVELHIKAAHAKESLELEKV